MPTQKLLRYVVNSGVQKECSKDDADPRIVKMTTPLLKTGDNTIPEMPDWMMRVVVEGDALILHLEGLDAGRRLNFESIVIAPNNEAANLVWPGLENHYRALMAIPEFPESFFKSPVRPATHPWCCVVKHIPGVPEMKWIADFEVGIAWAWLEKIGKSKS